jgi:integral membrane protein (TIGR01906 family)
LTLLLTALENNAYNKGYYLNQFEQNNTVEETGKTMDELSVIADDLINYIKGKGFDDLLDPHFNDKEIAHMRDVQRLFDSGRALKYISGGIALILLIYFGVNEGKRKLGKKLVFGLFANHILIILLAIIIASDFNKYWTIFHHIFFTNDLWLLDPQTDLMIQMLPEQFFSGMVIRIMLSFFIYLSIIQIAGLYYMKKGRGKWKDTKDSRKDI